MNISQRFLFAALFVIVAGCSAPAPVMPPDTIQRNEIASEMIVGINECVIQAPDRFQPILKKLCVAIQPYVEHRHIPRLTITPRYTLQTLGGVFLREEDRIEIPEATLRSPLLLDEAGLIIFHEFMHAVEKSMEMRGAFMSIETLARAYELLVISAGFDSETSYLHFSHITEQNPRFSIFDESSYVSDEHPSPYGHPYGSKSELFASALTIFRFFPDDFVSRFSALDTSAQETIRYVTEEIFNAILFYNADPDALKKLIPEYEKILKEIS